MAKRKKENEEPSDENPGQNDDSADNFGLPDIDYKPLDRNTEVVAETTPEPVPEPEAAFDQPYSSSEPEQEESTDYTDEDEPRSSAPLVISLVIGLVLVVSGFLLYKYWYVPRAEKAKQELAKAAAAKTQKEEEARLAREKEEAERKRLEAEAAAKATPPAGTIETLTATTRRYYVVVTSAIDGDLIMDFAKKLSAKGVSSKIIPPYGNTKFNRLAIGDFDTFNAAQSSADASKAQYGNAVWVMRY